MKYVQLEAGENIYKIRYTFNTLCDLEELTGKPIDELWGISSVRYLLWAGLTWNNSNFTLKKAGDIIQTVIEDGREPGEVLSKCLQALEESGFKGKDEDEGNE